jgi:hypothetical protein
MKREQSGLALTRCEKGDAVVIGVARKLHKVHRRSQKKDVSVSMECPQSRGAERNEPRSGSSFTTFDVQMERRKKERCLLPVYDDMEE